MKSIFTWLLVMFATVNVYSKSYHYTYTDNCSKAYRGYMSLNPELGDKYLKKELISDPYNLLATYISDYNDCLLLLFNGDRRDYEQLKHHQNARLKLLERGDDASPWYRLCKAGIYIHWAFVHLRFNEQLKAAFNFRKSYVLLRENKRMFPKFEYTDIFLGIEEATVGSIPDNYKWIASLFGMKGNVVKGVNSLERFITNHHPGDPLYEETLVYVAYMNYYLLSDKERAWQVVSEKEFSTDNNLLNSFVRVNVALNYRKAEEAIELLQQPQNMAKYNKYPIFYYEYGYALLHRLDTGAIHKFQLFLEKYHGKIFTQDALQKIACVYYLADNMEEAQRYRKKILSYDNAITDSDKQAVRFAQGSSWPDKTLFKAQLLTDGGYYKRADRLLNVHDADSYSTVADKLEYFFRKARVNDELGKIDTAIHYYNKAIDLGKDREEQFASRSALQLGFMYENQGKRALAVDMYRLALSMKNHDFKSSIDQQSKAGINRLELKK